MSKQDKQSIKDAIQKIPVNKANLMHIAETGTINGSLLIEIEKLAVERSNKTLQEYKELIEEIILWCEATDYKPNFYHKLKSLLHQPNRA